MGGGDLDERMRWLQPGNTTGDYADSDLSTLRAFGIKPP